jgi:hypothetical protein
LFIIVGVLKAKGIKLPPSSTMDCTIPINQQAASAMDMLVQINNTSINRAIFAPHVGVAADNKSDSEDKCSTI